MSYIIRPMKAEDIHQVSDIDREAFPTQWSSTPGALKRELRNHLAHYLVACESNTNHHEATPTNSAGRGLPVVATLFKQLFNWERFVGSRDLSSPEYIIGFSGFWMMLHEAHLTSIAVRGKHQRLGIGELLLISTIEQAITLKATMVTLEVRVSNTVAQALYDKYGFNRVGIRRGYYHDNGEDGLLMTTDTITSPSYQARFQQLKQTYFQNRGIPIVRKQST